MDRPKFLTVFAVFDDDTQKILQEYQNEILKLGRPGTQTMDIPFHITLGSFPTEMEQELIEKINVICEKLFQFELKLLYVNHFNDKVLFIQPEFNDILGELRLEFEGDFPYKHPYHPHTTIFIDDDVSKERELLTTLFKPFTAKIVSIQMGEFFPTRMIISKSF